MRVLQICCKAYFNNTVRIRTAMTTKAVAWRKLRQPLTQIYLFQLNSDKYESINNRLLRSLRRSTV
jgi:hypothetical protein